jgi:hypothetical protein
LRFDDRLQTMLDAPVADNRDRAVRWRQLVDLLSRVEPGVTSEAAGQALELVRRDAFAIDEAVRAATIRAIAGRTLSHDLLRVLAVQPVRVAAPLFAGMTMSADEAEEVLADADAEVRALVTVRAADIKPASTPEPEPVIEAEAEAVAPEVPSISDMVDRIERLQQKRQPALPPPPLPRRVASPALGEGRLFEWESDASGHIAWVEGAPRGALVGRPLGGDGAAPSVRRASPR